MDRHDGNSISGEDEVNEAAVDGQGSCLITITQWQ
jgi:hypothetical protein